MANLSNVTYTGNGVTVTFVLAFTYIEEADITVTVDDVVQVITTDYTFNGSGDVVFNTAPADTLEVYISRDSDVTQRVTTYADGSSLTEEDLNDGGDQSIYLHQETRDLITTINADNSALLGRVTQNETDISTNDTDIATNAGDISTNAAAIGSNVGNIAANASAISDNATDIATALATQVFTARIDEAGGMVVGDVVYINGATGNQMEASKAINSDFDKIEAIAICIEAGSDNDTVSFQNFGELSGVDTSSYTEGDELYLHSTAGELSATHPSGTNAVVHIARVVRVHATLGILFISINSHTVSDTFDGNLRQQIVNSSTGTSAGATMTVVNDAGHRMSIGLTGSNYNVLPNTDQALIIYNEGYGKTLNVIDGNKGFEWWTDVGDTHNMSSTSKMALSAAGELSPVSLDIGASTAVDGILDEDAMGSDSATKLATQQSIKAYVDTKVSLTGTETITNKTFDDEVTMKEISTPSTPASGYKSIYPKTDGKLYTLDDAGNEVEVGSGGGSGGINYMVDDNTGAETSVGDWVTYADAAGVNPVDGTGGSATITYTRNTTTPLRGDADFEYIKDAADRQGEGASCPFTIDKQDKGQRILISVDYDTSEVGYLDDEIRFSVYDITNAKLIRVSNESLKGGKGTHYASFQSASDSTSYRIIAHQSSDTTTAYVGLRFENFKVGPAGSVESSREISVKAYPSSTTVVASGVTTLLQFDDVTTDTTGSVTTGSGWRFTAPETGSYVVHLSDRISLNGLFNGTSERLFLQLLKNGNNTNSDVYMLYNSMPQTTTSELYPAGSAIIDLLKDEYFEVVADQDSGSNVTFQNGSYGRIGIQKLSSSGSSVSLGGNREVRLRGAGNAGLTITADTERIDFTTVEDTTGSWSQTAGHGLNVFTAPETGDYDIEGHIVVTSSTSATIKAYKNDTFSLALAKMPSATSGHFSGTISLNKNDTLDFRFDSTLQLSNSSTFHWIHIQKKSGGNKILGSINEVAYIYDEKTSGTSGGSFVAAAWRTRDLNVLDGQDWISLSSNQFTLQAGEYDVRALASAFAVNGNQTRIRNITDSTTEQDGIVEYTVNGGHSEVVARITIDVATTFELQHKCQSTNANGFGFPRSYEKEVYAQVAITKIL